MKLGAWFWQAPEYFNRWRVFPRGFIILYFWLCIETAMWFMALPVPLGSQAAFAGTIISAGAAWFGLYVNSGSKIVMKSPPSPPTPVILSVQAAPSNETKSDVPDYHSKG